MNFHRFVGIAAGAALILVAVLAGSAPEAQEGRDVDMRGIDRPIDDTFRKAVPPEREPKVLKQDWEGLKPGYGREDTYYACVTCHSIHRIKRSFKTRKEWAETLRRLEEEKNVPPLEEDEREVVLTYLSTQYGPAEPK